MEERSGSAGRQPLGPAPGLVLGVAAGLLISSVWAFGAWDVAVALTAMFAGLPVAVGVGAPGWRPFALAMAAAAAAVGGLIVLVAV